MKTKKPAKKSPKPRAAAKNKTEQTQPEAPMQGIWSGTISFSLVAIPVRLVKAVEPGRVSFKMLHGKDYSPLKRKMFCTEEGKIVSPEDIIRGFEISPGKHVMITDEELESVSPERSRTIEITEFIDAKEVDPVYYNHPYFLVPLKGGEKSYRLLTEAMSSANRAGIAKFVLGEREYLVEVKPRDGALALNTLHYINEILPDTTETPKEKPGEEEKNALKKTISKMMSDFKPEKYSDPRREKIMEMLKKKSKEKPPVESPEIEEGSAEGMEDLVEALEESMRKMKG